MKRNTRESLSAPAVSSREAALIGRRRPPRRRGRGGTRHLLEHWSTVAPALKAAKRLAVFLDFDGTLTPLRPRPEEVFLGPGIRHHLRHLARHPGIQLWILSGRRRSDLVKRTRLRGITCLGLHGWERGPGGHSRQKVPVEIRRARRDVRELLPPAKQVWVEDKQFSFAVHYRSAAPRQAREAHRIVETVVNRYSGELWLLKGKKVWEILPRHIPGKGEVIRQILKTLPDGTWPIYLGDDTTDESAFAALTWGLTVRVGPFLRTKARYLLRGPEEVEQFFEKLERELQ